MQVQEGNRIEMGRERFSSKLFQYFFCLQLFIIAILEITLIIRGMLSARTNHFHPKKWYVPAFASTACAGLVGLVWQACMRYDPSRTAKAAFWLGPLLTCAVGVLLVSISTAGSLATGALALVSAAFQSLYSCWANPQVEHAVSILSDATAFPPPNSTPIALLTAITCTLYSCFAISGIGGATATGGNLDRLFIFLILLSFTWTMHIIKNTIQVTVSHIKYMQFSRGEETDIKIVFTNTIKYSMGSICIGSLLIPVFTVIRGSARAISSASGDVDEFMFSCASCYSVMAAKLVVYGNRWGFVHVGVLKKGIVQASVDIWDMFRRVGMDRLINSDLTSSICFLCGVAGGAMCALVGGSCSLVLHKSYATEVSIYAFLIGYFMSRVAMAMPQASVSAYYVAYAENPQSQTFDTTIPVYIQYLQRYRT